MPGTISSVGMCMKKVIVLLLIVPLLTGCGTFFARTGWRDEASDIPRFYPAAALDCGMMCIWHNDPSVARKSLWRKLLWSSVGLIDLPISLVTDTVCLPFDIWNYHAREECWDDNTLEERHENRNN